MKKKLVKEDNISILYDKLTSIISQMKNLVVDYKNTTGEEQMVIVSQLKELTKQKKEIEFKLENAVLDKDAHVELADITEDRNVGMKLTRVIELMSKKQHRENNISNRKTKINEYGKKTALSILEELFDDYLMQSEMMIDQYYGQVDVQQFKEMWMKSSRETSIKFTNIVKNMRT